MAPEVLEVLEMLEELEGEEAKCASNLGLTTKLIKHAIAIPIGNAANKLNAASLANSSSEGKP